MRILTPAVALVAALFLTGATCSSPTGEPAAPADASQLTDAGDTQTDDCAARGGEMRRVGRMGSLQCIVPYADAGQSCTDSDQCAGDCRLPEGAKVPLQGGPVTGVCQANNDRFGCYTTVENGRAGPTICVD